MALLCAVLLGVSAGAARAADDDFAGPASVTQQDRDLVESELGPQFVYPDTTVWQYLGSRPFVGDGKIICGRVNTMNAARQWRGFQRFFALLRGGKLVQSGFEVDRNHDSLQAVITMLNQVCPANP